MPPTSASVDFYLGSRLLQPLTSVLGLSIDQVNFLACQIFALIIGFPFRRFFHPKTTNPKVRHAVEFILGVALLLFCFGRQIWHVFAHAIIGYLLMQFLGRKWMPHVVFIFALGYLSVGHIYRMIFDYGGFTLDITGPLMITVQKITSIAFALHDGTQVEAQTLNPNQKSKAIKKMPDLLSYLSYMFCFHDVMCGPFVFYHDYLAFIDGSCYVQSAKGGSDDQKADDNIPSPLEPVLKKLIVCVILGTLMMLEPYIVPWERLKDEEFLYQSSWAYKMVYLLCSMTMHRPMYYFAWILGELVNNSCGLGFNGYDEKGKAKWNLMCNVDIYNLEFSTSLKVNIDSWNVTTSHWLRYAVYERVPSSVAVWVVFIVSAFWHGFYPGYYIAFLTAALFTTAARLVRRNIRPYFLQSSRHILFYDFVTFWFTRFANCYFVFPFALLEAKQSIILYMAIYWWLHILSVLVIVYFTFIHKMFHRSRKDNNSQKAN